MASQKSDGVESGGSAFAVARPPNAKKVVKVAGRRASAPVAVRR